MLRIWIDCTAAAHPLVLRPLIERFQAAGHEVAVTAREYGQTLGILERLGIEYESVGRHAGAGTVAKATALARRSGALGRWARRRRFDLALGQQSNLPEDFDDIFFVVRHDASETITEEVRRVNGNFQVWGMPPRNVRKCFGN